jgi:hypothetical protein
MQTNCEMEAGVKSVPPAKRGRGRPRKSVVGGAEGGGDGATPQRSAEGGTPLKSDASLKKNKKKKSEVATPATVDVTLVGQQVTGVLDGSCDVGYLLSVRVGNTDTVLRGVVFQPGLPLPISKLNDVAPTVMHVKRDETILPPVAPAAALVMPAVPSISTVPGPAAMAIPGIVPSTSILPAPFQRVYKESIQNHSPQPV